MIPLWDLKTHFPPTVTQLKIDWFSFGINIKCLKLHEDHKLFIERPQVSSVYLSFQASFRFSVLTFCFFRMEIDFDLPFYAASSLPVFASRWRQFVDWNAAAKLLKAETVKLLPIFAMTFDMRETWGQQAEATTETPRWNSCLINRSQLSATLYPFRTLPSVPCPLSTSSPSLVLTGYAIGSFQFDCLAKKNNNNNNTLGALLLSFWWFVACPRHVLRSQRLG